jgi:hypothetical protein
MERSVYIPIEDINTPTFDCLCRVVRAIAETPDHIITRDAFIAATGEHAIVADTFIEIFSGMGVIAQTVDGRLTLGVKFQEFNVFAARRAVQ